MERGQLLDRTASVWHAAMATYLNHISPFPHLFPTVAWLYVHVNLLSNPTFATSACACSRLSYSLVACALPPVLPYFSHYLCRRLGVVVRRHPVCQPSREGGGPERPTRPRAQDGVLCRTDLLTILQPNLNLPYTLPRWQCTCFSHLLPTINFLMLHKKQFITYMHRFAP